MLIVKFEGSEWGAYNRYHVFTITNQSSRLGGGLHGGKYFSSRTMPGMQLKFDTAATPQFWIGPDGFIILFGWGACPGEDNARLAVPQEYLMCFLEIVASENTDGNLSLGQMVRGLDKIKL